MPEDNEGPEISKQLRLARTQVRPQGPRPGGLRAAAISEARAAANPSEATEPVLPPAAPAAPAEEPETAALLALKGLAIYEGLRALVMCSVFAMSVAQTNPRLADTEWDFYYIASNGSIEPTLMAVVYTIVAVVVGAGLWTRQLWARWAITLFALIAVVQYGAWIFLFSFVEASMRQPDMTQIDLAKTMTYSMVFVNLLIAVYMGFSPAAAAVFGRTASEPSLRLPPTRPSGT
jgi:hypothetical protein